jgi:hypothetical protein
VIQTAVAWAAATGHDADPVNLEEVFEAEPGLFAESLVHELMEALGFRFTRGLMSLSRQLAHPGAVHEPAQHQHRLLVGGQGDECAIPARPSRAVRNFDTSVKTLATKGDR